MRDEAGKGSQQFPHDDSLVINTRLNEVERQQREDKESDRKHNRSQLRTNRLLAVFTGLLFATSVISDVLMLRYVDLTKKSADAAKSAADSAEDNVRQSVEQSRLDQRAWLGIIEAGTTPSLADGTHLDLSLVMINSGKTPAIKVQQRSRWRVLSVDISFDPDVELKAARVEEQGVIQPNGRRILSSRFDQPLTAEQRQAIISHAARAFVVGQITYQDIFMRDHLTKYCMELRIDSGQNLAMGPCANYNEAD